MAGRAWAWAGALMLLPVAALDNGRAMTPPAGWTAWNTYAFRPTQRAVERSMRALAEVRRPGGRSLASLGYVQANLDDGWQACGRGVNGSFHDAAGNPLFNARFPDVGAMTALGASLGIEPGIYMNNCLCPETGFADAAFVEAAVRQSAAAVARLGFKSLKVDSCGQFNNLTAWAAALNATGVAIAIENCHQGGQAPGQPGVPGQRQCAGTGAAGDVSDCPYTSFRTSDDIQPTWAHVVNNVNSLVPYLGDEAAGDPPPRSRPGGWAYPDALQTGAMGVLSPSGHTPRPDGWTPAPLVEDRSQFGMHCITSSPLILSFNLTNASLVRLVWPIVANEEALRVNREWAGTPGRLVATLRPGSGAVGGGFVLRAGRVGKFDGWGHDALSRTLGLTCPADDGQPPGNGAAGCNLLRVAMATPAEAQAWCAAHAACAAFSYRPGPNASRTAVYFKPATQLSFADSNFRSTGEVLSGWMTQFKAALAPPGAWRSAPCGGTVCPPLSPPCHTACFSIAPCCSETGPPGETLDFAPGEAQLWSKRLRGGRLALLFVNLGERTTGRSFSFAEVGFRLDAGVVSVAVRDVWRRADCPPIGRDGVVEFGGVAGHDSRFIILTPQHAGPNG